METNNLPLARYRGVSRQTKSVKPLWKAQIVRMNQTFYLGVFATPNLAADAYDNAAYYSKDWVSNEPAYNNPGKWCIASSAKNYPISTAAKRMVSILTAKHPQELERRRLMEVLTPAQRYESECQRLTRNLEKDSVSLTASLSGMISQIKFVEAQNKLLVEDILKRDRIIEGLTAAGGRPIFRRVGDNWEKSTEVENHLTNPT